MLPQSYCDSVIVSLLMCAASFALALCPDTGVAQCGINQLVPTAVATCACCAELTQETASETSESLNKKTTSNKTKKRRIRIPNKIPILILNQNPSLIRKPMVKPPKTKVKRIWTRPFN